MSHNLIDDPNAVFNEDAVVVPDDGDYLEALSVETPFQELANRTAQAHAYLTGLKINAVLVQPTLQNPSITGNVTIAGNGDLEVTGDTVLQQTLTANGTSEFNDAVTCYNGLDVAVGALSCTGQMIISGHSRLSSSATVGGLLTCENGLTATGGSINLNVTAITLGSAAATATVPGVLTPSGAGRIRRKTVLGTDAASTTTLPLCATTHWPASVLTTTRTAILPVVGVSDGDWIRVSTRDGTNQVNISIPIAGIGSPSSIVLKNATSTNIIWADFEWVGGAWHMTGYKDVP